MRFPAFTFVAALFALMLLSGCSWLPEYMKAKAAINARYEAREEKIELRYSQGKMSDEAYEKAYEELYRQWDDELTAAKARAQGYEVASSRGTSRKRRAPSGTAKPAQFDTYTAEYVGSGSQGAGSGNAASAPAAAQPPR